jgi:hypothetical protein
MGRLIAKKTWKDWGRNQSCLMRERYGWALICFHSTSHTITHFCIFSLSCSSAVTNLFCYSSSSLCFLKWLLFFYISIYIFIGSRVWVFLSPSILFWVFFYLVVLSPSMFSYFLSCSLCVWYIYVHIRSWCT